MEVTEEISLGESVFLEPKFTPDDETLPIMYRVSAEIVGEPTPLCSQLVATGTTSPFFYTGQLTELVTEPASTTGHGLLEVSLASADGVAPGATCTVDIVYRGWHKDSPENSGYTDEERDRFAFVIVAAEEEVAEDVVVDEPAPEPEPNNVEPEAPPVEPEPEPIPEPEPTPEPLPEPEPEVQNFSPSGGGGDTEPTEPLNEPVPQNGAPEGGDSSPDAEAPEPPAEAPPAETPAVEEPPVEVPPPPAETPTPQAEAPPTE